MFVDDQWPGLKFPVTPGHEIAGRIDAIGESVEGWHVGDRVAIGWSGGYCPRRKPIASATADNAYSRCCSAGLKKRSASAQYIMEEYGFRRRCRG
jgi:D-arabinose 1-dehydrogenase-like Zn-dependent alcohol dehydrogenase